LWTLVAVAGFIIFAGLDRYMPYIPQYAGFQGIGPTDVRGSRPMVIPDSVGPWFTGIVLVSTVLFALFLSHRLFAHAAVNRSGASLLVMIGMWQVVGVLIPSFHFRNWIISVDRYLLPLIPFAIVLFLWALRDTRLLHPVAWVAVGFYAVFSIVGTRDFLVFQDATWDMAHHAIDAGVPITALDGGASWDGYYLYEYSESRGITQQTPNGPWWTDLFGPATESTYVVSTEEQPGYEVVDEATYSSWLDGESNSMLLLRRIKTSNIP
jgi:hypothetical protein